jgi:predicted transposase/invertase (TIGR01784 family)
MVFNDAERYLNFYTDYGFKRLFGSEPSKHILKDLLNALMASENKGVIESVTYLKNEQVGDFELDRKCIYDIYCLTDRGEHFIIELQKVKQKYFKDRTLFYSVAAICEQQQQGDWNFRLAPVYVVAILDFILDDRPTDPLSYRHDVALREAGAMEPFYDKLFFIYLEMPKFTKKSSELQSHFEKWMYALRNLNRLNDVPTELREQVFEEFFRVAEIDRFSPEERAHYEESRKLQLSVDVISRVSGLPHEEIEKLR